MLKYAMQTGRMNEMMELLFRVLDLRITFFDLQECEVDGFNIKEMSAFCRHRRRQNEFDACCQKCDQEHLRTAKQTGNVHIYHCHAGLLEGIVPLYDHHQIYLGAIVFGQLRDRERRYDLAEAAGGKHLLRIRESTRKEMHDVGVLLKYISEYIVENELIQYCNKSWVERLENYIGDHFTERLTIERLSTEIGRSASFLSHNFPLEFGVPLKEYILKLRMDRAKELLQSGETVRKTASALGYYDEFHFSKEFKRYYAVSPGALKRHILG